MGSNVLGFYGRKRSGKDSAANYFVGRLLVKNEIIERFDIDDDGLLLVNNHTPDGQTGMGVLDLQRRDPGFVAFCSEMIWPIVRTYHFADELKMICMNLYDLTPDQCYGSSEDKESESRLTWGDFSSFIKKNQIPKGKSAEDKLTAREVLQTVSDILKKIKSTCWSDCVLEAIKNNYSTYSIIADVRYDFEVKAIKDAGGKVIAFNRTISQDEHASELGLDGVDNSLFDAIIDNQNMTIQEKNNELDRILQSWGWL